MKRWFMHTFKSRFYLFIGKDKNNTDLKQMRYDRGKPASNSNDD